MKLFQFLVAALLLVSSSVVLAEKPDPNVPNPPLQVQEYNVDADGYIAVHEQGTANVEVQGTADVNVTGGTIDASISGGSVTVDNTNANPVPIAGSVGVDNFPGQQGVWVDGGYMSPVTKAFYDAWIIPATKTQGPEYFVVGPILATTIYVSDWDNETRVFFHSTALAPANEHIILEIFDSSAAQPEHTISFPYPVEIDAVSAQCQNSSDDCRITITVVGF